MNKIVFSGLTLFLFLNISSFSYGSFKISQSFSIKKVLRIVEKKSGWIAMALMTGGAMAHTQWRTQSALDKLGDDMKPSTVAKAEAIHELSRKEHCMTITASSMATITGIAFSRVARKMVKRR